MRFAAAVALLAVGCGDDPADSCCGDDDAICLCDLGLEEGCTAAGGILCGSRCVLDPDSDPNHCGECGNTCVGNGYCLDGRCGTCAADEVVCGSMCCAAGCSPAGDACAEVPCGSEPPVAGTGCGPIDRRCLYLRCDTVGEIRADCLRSGWRVETWPCEGADCGLDEPCAESELCLVRDGDGECIANPCGEAGIDSSCACDPCAEGDRCTLGPGDRVISCRSE